MYEKNRLFKVIFNAVNLSQEQKQLNDKSFGSR